MLKQAFLERLIIIEEICMLSEVVIMGLCCMTYCLYGLKWKIPDNENDMNETSIQLDDKPIARQIIYQWHIKTGKMCGQHRRRYDMSQNDQLWKTIGWHWSTFQETLWINVMIMEKSRIHRWIQLEYEHPVWSGTKCYE